MEASTAPLARPSEARRARRDRAHARIEAALQDNPELRTERLRPIHDLIALYREHDIDPAGPTPLAAYVARVREEVRALEATARRRSRAQHQDGAVIRSALCFLRAFGRISALDYDLIPIEERGLLVLLLGLEYRWCFFAAGTTPTAFKIAIGRTGAR